MICCCYEPAEEPSQTIEKDSAPAAKKTKASNLAKDDAEQVPVVDLRPFLSVRCDKYCVAQEPGHWPARVKK